MSRKCSIIETNNEIFVIPYSGTRVDSELKISILDSNLLELNDTIIDIDIYRDTVKGNTVHFRAGLRFVLLPSYRIYFCHTAKINNIVSELRSKINKINDKILTFDIDNLRENSDMFSKYFSYSRLNLVSKFLRLFNKDEFEEFKIKFTKFDNLNINQLPFRIQYNFKKQQYLFHPSNFNQSYRYNSSILVDFTDINFVSLNSSYHSRYNSHDKDIYISNESEVNSFKLTSYLIKKEKGNFALDKFLCAFEKELIV